MVYVDDPIWPLGRMMMCHMMADTEEELHAMAERLGLRREWFQAKHGKTPHYDVSTGKRELAVAAGALEVDREACVALMKRLRAEAAPARTGRDTTEGGKGGHPLRWLFMLRAFGQVAGMNWLQGARARLRSLRHRRRCCAERCGARARAGGEQGRRRQTHASKCIQSFRPV